VVSRLWARLPVETQRYLTDRDDIGYVSYSIHSLFESEVTVAEEMILPHRPCDMRFLGLWTFEGEPRPTLLNSRLS
jgi:hypothetical protein